jgi:hypothetical protein
VAKKTATVNGKYIFVKSNPRPGYPTGKWKLVYHSKGCRPKTAPKNSVGVPGQVATFYCHSSSTTKVGVAKPMCGAQCNWTVAGPRSWSGQNPCPCPNGCSCNSPVGDPQDYGMNTGDSTATDCILNSPPPPPTKGKH